mmetsp:Transcript_86513/g.231904  ORF Transcript_86513/g.231904 Transcript_86513/m.231904 type:complete len:339 (-) Transcript_86513:820-1836(-)
MRNLAPHLGVLLKHRLQELLGLQALHPPPREDHPLRHPRGQDRLHDGFDHRPPEVHVQIHLLPGPLRGGPRGLDGEGGIHEQHALRQHGLEPLRRRHHLVVLQQLPHLRHAYGLPHLQLVHHGGLDDAPHALHRPEPALLPGLEGVVEVGDARGGLHAGVRGLAEGHHLPGCRRVGLQGLEGHLPHGDDALVAARPDKLASIPQPLDDRAKNRLPGLAVGAAFEQRCQTQRVIRGHRGRLGRRRGFGIRAGRGSGLFLSRGLLLGALVARALARVLLAVLLRLAVLLLHQAGGALLDLTAHGPPDHSCLPSWVLHIGLLTLRKIHLVRPGPTLHIPRG